MLLRMWTFTYTEENDHWLGQHFLKAITLAYLASYRLGHHFLKVLLSKGNCVTSKDVVHSVSCWNSKAIY
uniref:Uncharacterized protein n=1 Tax=Oryza glumipatula TaxID=40148 RepID=A0A0E0AUB9_9ORYZ